VLVKLFPTLACSFVQVVTVDPREINWKRFDVWPRPRWTDSKLITGKAIIIKCGSLVLGQISLLLAAGHSSCYLLLGSCFVETRPYAHEKAPSFDGIPSGTMRCTFT